MLLLSTKRFACSLYNHIYIYVLDPGISETLISSFKSVQNNKQQRSGQEANAAIGEGHLIQLLIHGLFHLQELWLKITLTKGQKMCRNTASCLKLYSTLQYAGLKIKHLYF